MSTRHATAILSTVLFLAPLMVSPRLRAQAPQTPTAPPTARPQAPTPSQPSVASTAAPSDDTRARRLPIRRVVLYKSGVGYFEHVGRIQGDQAVTIDLTSRQLDDVLKSLTTVDLGNGRVTGITFNSVAPLEQRLQSLRLPLDSHATRAELLMAARGSRVDVQDGLTRVTGRIFTIESRKRERAGTTEDVQYLAVVSDAGAVHSFELRAGVHVRLLDGDVRGELTQYLDVIASSRTPDLRSMSVQTNGTGARDLFVSYISEVPVWKSSYRLVIPKESTRRPFLQGWAIVDNTLGEDWTSIRLSLVAGAPQSFRHPLSQPVLTERPLVPLSATAPLAPQTHAATLTDGRSAVSGTVVDSGGGAIPGATVIASVAGQVVAATVTGSDGSFSFEGVPAGSVVVEASLQGFTTARSSVVVQAGRRTTVSLTLGIGALSESVSVTSQGADPRARRRTPPKASDAAVKAAPPAMFAGAPSPALVTERLAQSQAAAAGADLGDLFEYTLNEPVTIGRNQSALVPILQSPVTVERVSIWNAASPSARPLRAVWLTNDTGATLDGGAIALMEGNAFAGEGLLEPIKPRERRLISFAADLAGRVSATSKGEPRRISRIRIASGVMTQHVEERSTTVYTARNEDSEARTFILEHQKRSGWSLAKDAVEPAESTSALYRFRLVVPPNASADLRIEEVHPVETRVSLSTLNNDQVALILRGRNLDPAVEPQLRAVMAQAREVARLADLISQKESELERIEDDQARVRQNLAALKTSAEERALVIRYVEQITKQEDRIDVLEREIDEQEAAHARATEELTRRVNAITLDVEMP